MPYNNRQPGNPGQRPRKRAKTVIPIVVKDTWTHDFCVLSKSSTRKTPSMLESSTLTSAGLGKKRIVFDKNGSFDHVKETLEKNFPKLASQRGAFELLRADRGGANRPLVAIPVRQSGYSVPYLRDIVSTTATIYVIPIQSDLSTEMVTSSTTEMQVTTECVNCYEKVPIQDMRKHIDVCGGGCSSRNAAISEIQDDDDSDWPTVNFDEDSGCIDLTLKDDWAQELQKLFPDATSAKINTAITTSTTLQEAAGTLCDETDAGSSQRKCDEDLKCDDDIQGNNIKSLLDKFAHNLKKHDEISLTVEREEVWSGALSFYKKSLSDPERLLKSLCVTFQGEPGLDAGAIKAEFFEIVFGQIQSRLFEGNEYALVPVRDSSKGLLFKLAGLAIAHSLLQSGPSFHALSPAVYYYLTSADQDLIATHLEKKDIPENAGNIYTCTPNCLI